MTSDKTTVEREGGLVVVTFNRPHKKNALNQDSWNDLDEILTEVAGNPDDRALLLTGAGGNFSSGADLSGGLGADDGAGGGSGERKGGLTGKGPQPIVQEMRVVGEIIARLQRLPKPTVAAVDGYAVGVALGLVLACDLVVATDRARFTEVFVKRGLALDGGASWTLPRLIGTRRAKQLTFFGEPLDARLALEWGLINEVVAPEALEETALAWGRKLASGPTLALSMIKRLIDGSGNLSFEQAVEEEARCQHIAYTTKDMGEGIRAFLERRDPEFTGT